ncbi:hypothetical protein BH24ACT15_BH24ACT15_16940 [soil metagenome]
MSGTLGDDIPGPSSYWIDAIAHVQPDVADRLRTDLTVEPANESPAVIEPLVEEIPSGVLLTGPELNDAFSESGFMVQAYMSQDSDRVVLVARGQ